MADQCENCKWQTSLPVARLYNANVRVPSLLGLMGHHKTTDVPTDSHPTSGELIDLPVSLSDTDPSISYRSHPLAMQPDWQPMLGNLVQTLTTVGVLLVQTLDSNVHSAQRNKATAQKTTGHPFQQAWLISLSQWSIRNMIPLYHNPSSLKEDL